MSLNAVDLFCGAGGLSLGLEWSGFRIVVANDYDPDSCLTFQRNHPASTVICGDISRPSVFRRVIDAASDFGDIDLLAGGPPCQGFSQMRNFSRFIDDPRNKLYRRFVAVLAELRPRAFVMENVPGLRELDGVADQILRDLRLKGLYRVGEPRVLEAADFGVPQRRRRLFFVGIRNDVPGEVSLPLRESLLGSVELRKVIRSRAAKYEVRAHANGYSPNLLATLYQKLLVDPEADEFVTVRQAIGDLEGLAPREGADEMERLREPTTAYQRLMARNAPVLFNHEVPAMNRDTMLRLKSIPPGGNFLDIAAPLQRRYLGAQRWGPHTGRSSLSRLHYYAYRKLHPDFVSWTVNTKADFAYHYQRVPRAVTVREAARLQSFPDKYRFLVGARDLPARLYGGRRHSLYRQVGNAVPPLLARAVGAALRRALQTGA